LPVIQFVCHIAVVIPYLIIAVKYGVLIFYEWLYEDTIHI
jgi:hypothetical protein